MKSKILYKNEEMQLTDDFIDIGYMAKNFVVINLKNEEINIKKASTNRNIQILLSFTNFD